jgi:large subunit ribosomal protein L18
MANANQQFEKRRARVRRTLKARASGRPRLSIHRSSKHIYAQIIDDLAGKTLAQASTVEAEVKAEVKYGGNKTAAAVVGRVVADRAKKAGVEKVCFDRRSYKYHGRVEALATAAREGGLQF